MSSSVDGGAWQKPEEMLTTDGVLTFFLNCWAEFENEAECVDNKLFNLLFEMLENSFLYVPKPRRAPIWKIGNW